MGQNNIRIIIVVFLGIILSGCAFKNLNIVMPEVELSKPIQGGKGRNIVVAVPFTDKRDIQRCGMQKNGYNMDTADAICTTDPDVWLANLLIDELRKSGFSVIQQKTTTHTVGDLQIEGMLLKLFMEPVIGFWSGSIEADIHVKLIASSNNGLVAERNFYVKGRQRGVMASITPVYEAALRRATTEILRDMVKEIISLMDSYSEVGSKTHTTEKHIVIVSETYR